ncbi:MAG: hypothetical protein OEY97_01155 [Nitrospirota bacterium]|nr:hypothetical protein [Nitrospirota bacterium]
MIEPTATTRPLRRYAFWAVFCSGAVLALGAGACTVPIGWDLLTTGGTRVLGGPEGWLLISLFGGVPFVAGLMLLVIGTRLLDLPGNAHSAAGLAMFAAGLCAVSAINLSAVASSNLRRNNWGELFVLGGVPLVTGMAGLALAVWTLTRQPWEAKPE